MTKNTGSQVIGAQLVSATDGSAFTGSVTAYVTGDGGTQSVGSVGSGACTHEGNGYHTYAPAQAETNYDVIAFTFVGTGAVPVTVQVFTTAQAKGTTTLATASALATAQADLDTVTGTDGATLATSQPNYAPATAASLATAQADLDTLTGTDGATLATSQPNYAPATAASASAIEADTQDIQSRLPAALVSGRMSSDAVAISGSTAAADAVEANIGNLDDAITDAVAAPAAALTSYDPPTYTEVLNLFRVALRKDSAIATDLAAVLTAINADLASGGGAFANTTEALEAIRDRGDAAWTTGATAPTAADIRSEIDANSTQLAAIVADTNELQTDWADGGRLDLILDARASQTTASAIETDTQDIQSRLPAALVSGRMSSDAVAISGSTVAADAVEANIGNLDDAVSDAVAAPAAALTSYDPPTRTEATADKDEVLAVLPSALVGGRIDASIGAVNGDATAAANLEGSTEVIVRGTVDTSAHTPTTTEFEADDITEATADHYIGRIVIFRTGALAGQATDITDYALAGSNGHFTVTALTEAPGNDDTFVIV